MENVYNHLLHKTDITVKLNADQKIPSATSEFVQPNLSSDKRVVTRTPPIVIAFVNTKNIKQVHA